MSRISRMKTPATQLRSRQLCRLAAVAVSFLASVVAIVPRALAQGCAMCYQNAAASGEQGRAALRHGILILLLPAVGLFLGIFGLIYSRRHPSQR
jgi:hypothetical protein